MNKAKSIAVLSVSVLMSLCACGGGTSSSQAPASSGTSSTSVSSEVSSSSTSSVKPTVNANGVFNYVYATAEQKEEILGKLEKWAIDNKVTGLTLYGDGGYVMYNPVVKKGSNTYIPGYGFGILAEGELIGDLEGETTDAWKRYYHAFETEDPKTMNYMDDKGAVVGDLIPYAAGSYFQTVMNETKDGYEWIGSLAKQDRPIGLNPDEHGLSTKFRFEVKVGSELKYSTDSAIYSEFNNREVALEDYVTPYKLYYTKLYGYARSAENLEGAGSIKGSKAYYDGSGEGFNQELWDEVGIKTVVENSKNYLEFELNVACTPFFAMYYLNSSMFAPVPADFIEAIGKGDFVEGAATWGKSSTDASEGILDHWLCTGPYMLERWDKDQQIVFKKNPNDPDAELGLHKIAGVHINILSAAAEDPEAALNQFLANKIHACSIPSTKLNDYKNDPRATVTGTSSTYKMNMNTCDKDTWEALFGENGTVTQTPKEEYWEVEPAMNNKNFTSGISFALDRQGLAKKLGRSPAFEYFGDDYLIDPENSVAYNTTEAHKKAIASIAEGTDGYGYSLELAKASFKKACDELIAAGTYKAGDTITIQVAYQTEAQIKTTGDFIASNLKDAFNDCGGQLTLEVENWAGPVWSDVYYKKAMVGQFDLAFGSISGNAYDPLNFLEVLKSDNSSGFTLNWGLDTNVCDQTIEFDGHYFSFDALWQATQTGVYCVDGKNAPLYTFGDATVSANGDGTYSAVFEAKLANVVEGETVLAKAEIEDVVIYGYNDTTAASDYDEMSCEFVVGEDGKVTVTVTAQQSAFFTKVAFGFDIYCSTWLMGEQTLDCKYVASIDAILPQA